MQLLNDKGAPFDIRGDDFDGIQLNYAMSSTSTIFPFNFSTVAGLPDFAVLLPCILVLISLMASLLSINALYRIYRAEELYFMSKSSYMSMATIAIMNFQFFGVFMLLGLNYVPQYFQYLTITAVNCFLCSVVANKLAYYFFLAQNQNHPRILANGLMNPRVRFSGLLLFAMLAFYVVGFSLIRFPNYAWFCTAFFIYPLIHVISTAQKSSRGNFRW